MKKTKKALASLAIAGMALTMVPFNAFATGTVPTRLAGTTAAQTAVAIADQTGWTGTAILASSASYGMVDALTSGPLATFLKAPILLQEPGVTLNAATKAELTKLNITKVYVTSGTAVISQAVLDQLTGMGITVVSLGGADRFETSVNIAKEMVTLGAPVSKVAVAYGWLNQDALSIAAIASASSSPILLTEKNALPASVSAFLTANAGVTSADVIGGTAVISDAVKAALPNATRHYGNTAYDTNNQVIQDFASSLTFDNVYAASGVTGIDALAGAPLAAQTKSPIVLTDGKSVPAVAVFTHSKASDSTIVTALGGEAVVPETIRAGIAAGIVTPVPGDLSVTSVSAVSATGFKVAFNHAPADTSKVTFTVERSTTPVTVTTAWNADKTEATVSSASSLPEGSYTVAVKNDTTDLGTSTVAISAQKIAKINITSTKLSVTSGNIGYATYNVLDQYGNDITTSSLANSLTFQSGVGTVTASKGLLKLTPAAGAQNLIQFPTITITGYDSTSGVSTNATLTTSSVLGTLSNMTLNTLTNTDGKVLTDGDTSSVFYIDYTATDASGNATKDYSLVTNGLITSTINANKNCLTSSNSNVLAQVVPDPIDSSKAAIKVTVVGNSNLSMDLPVTITAMSYAGTTSTLNVTLKKAAAVDTFTLMAPAYDIAVNEAKEIPFVAYDQNGSKLTQYDDIMKDPVTFSPNDKVVLSKNVDGTAKLTVGKFSNDGPQIITAMTSTGKFSTLTLNIQKAAKADTLSLDSSKLITAMQENATQGVDFGKNYGGFTVNDQYGRVVDMTGAPGSYEIYAHSSDPTVVDVAQNDGAKKLVAGASALASGANGIHVNAQAKPGSATVTFDLIDSSEVVKDSNGNVIANPTPDQYTVLDSKATTFSVLDSSDIKGYTMDTVASPIYANAPTIASGTTVTPQNMDFEANPHVYGTTASGAKVMLDQVASPITGAFLSNSTDFSVDTTATLGSYDSVNVYARQFADSAKTGASTTLTVTLTGADGTVQTVSTPITSSTAAPVASTIGVYVDTTVAGTSVDGDTITVASKATLGTMDLARFDGTGANNRASIYFYALDQYGKKASSLASIVKVTEIAGTPDGAGNVAAANADFVINSDGTIKTNNVGAKQYVVLSGITFNGLQKTIKIVFTN